MKQVTECLLALPRPALQRDQWDSECFSSPLKYISQLWSVKFPVSVTFWGMGQDGTDTYTHRRTDTHIWTATDRLFSETIILDFMIANFHNFEDYIPTSAFQIAFSRPCQQMSEFQIPVPPSKMLWYFTDGPLSKSSYKSKC